MLHLDDISAKQHTLSIRLAPNGFSFFILDVTHNKVAAFKHFNTAPHQDVITSALASLQSEEIFSYPFSEVRVMIDFPEVTCVPSSLYNEDYIDQLFALNADAGLKEYVISNSSKAYDLEVLFPVPQQLYQFFNKNFQKILFIHKLTNQLSIAHSYKEKAREQLFISYAGEHFSAVALRNNSLIYHNCFTLITLEDFTYYLLLVFQELEFDQYQAQVLIDGELDADHSALLVVKEYIKQVNFSKKPTDLSFAEAITAPEHYYSNLLALSYCE